MKPEFLSFIGLKSYSEQVEIDFSILTSGGLFGIFGSTGSGKSTILDAMFLALYGDFPESNVATSDFINAKTGYLSVEFIFSIKNGESVERYLVKREYKAKGTKKTVPQPKGIIYKFDGENKMALTENATQTTQKVEEILGLKIDQFVKCIVVPQGQFSAFLSLNRGERLKMMSGLFDLDKFGYKLQEKVRNDLARLSEEESRIEGKLSAYLEYTKESLALTEISLNEAQERYENENVKLSKIKQELSDYKNYYDRHKTLIDKQIRLESLEKSSSQIDRLSANLQRYEKSKYALEIYEKINQMCMDNSVLKVELKKKQTDLDTLKNDFVFVSKDYEMLGEKKEKIDEVKMLLASLVVLENDINNKKEIERKIDQEIKTYKQLDKEKKSLEEQSSLLSLELKKQQEEKLALRLEERVEKIISSISLSSNQVVPSEIDFLRLLKQFVFESKQELVLNRIEELKELLSSNDGNNTSLIDLKTLLEDNDKLNGIISAKQGELNRVISRIEILQSKIESCVENGKKLRQDIADIDAKVSKACSGLDYYEKVNELNEQIKLLDNEISKINSKFIDYSKLIPECDSQVKIILGKIQTNEEQIEKFSKDLTEKLEGMNIEEAKAVVDMISDPEDIKSAIEKYKLEKNSLKEAILELEKSIPKNEYSQDILDEMQQKVAEVEKNTKIFYENYIKLKKSFENISQKLEERCIIEKNYNALKKEKDLYSLLLNSVRSSRLLEFVADEYLCDISYDANETLGILSNGKFGLKYDKEFLVIDYNNAVERKTSTVSGGELFLVSLSLALSLSKSIIAKTNKPIEFFFLDEGFGSLDSALVETVIDSLEKLKNESFTIGVISHVEALKERIATKVIVTEPKNGFGSRVKVTN